MPEASSMLVCYIYIEGGLWQAATRNLQRSNLGELLKTQGAANKK